MEEYSSPTQFKVDVPSVEITLDAGDLARTMRPSDVVNLIIELDGEVGEWEATILLYRYFKEQVELARSQGCVPHLLDASDAQVWESLHREESLTLFGATDGQQADDGAVIE